MYVEVLSVIANDMLVDFETLLVVILADLDGDQIAI
jgi:hypothetical protein